ncbi:porin family protein [Campylobacter sp. faydin G-140]|uniref:outer membrane beta-barrel protein n=1 Tax=Campylobacter anatolicus TaxID=2829105 RepID=UPI001B9AE733|nr:outer membrane beta-barrel protein [Campylobacter anatolicus]MBR8461799.1 porin family protein [Campylobacter anatolicus]MBR8465111.1 porin family protein [Campylobacter anatolicus]
MKILVRAALIGSLVCSVALADGAFVGFGGDYSFKSTLKDDENNKLSDGQFGLNLKAGYDFDIFRIYGEYGYDLKTSKESEDSKFSWKKHNFLVGADYTPAINDSFKIAFGAYTGLSSNRLTEEFNGDKNQAMLNGWVLGAKVGGIYSFDTHNEIEFGYKFDRTDYKKSEEYGDTKETNHGIYIGYNYKF